MRELTITTRDGVSLAGSLATASNERGGVVIASAMGVPQSFYDRFVGAANDKGLSVLTFDYRHMGASRRLPLTEAEGSMLDWGRLDLAAAIDALHDRVGPVGLVAHSVGAQVFGLSPAHGKVRAALCVAAAHGWVGHFPSERRAALEEYWQKTVPTAIAAHGYFPGASMMTADLPAPMASEWARWCMSPHYLSNDDGTAIRDHFDQVRIPMRFVTVTDDDMAPEPAVRALASLYPNADVEVRCVKPEDHGGGAIGHFGYLRRPALHAAWNADLDWITDLIGRPGAGR